MNNKLIKLAYEFRATELWEALADNDIFAVQLHDGKIGYCSVMGNSVDTGFPSETSQRSMVVPQ